MYNIIQWCKMLSAVLAGFVSWLYGGLDVLLAMLIVCVITDYITGIFAAVYTKTLNSHVGFRGILKKIVILLVVGLGALLARALEQPTIRDMVIGFYIANEGISILENAGRMDIPVCNKLTDFLEQLKSNQSSR